MNSTIVENMDDTRRFIEQMDEQLPVEILAKDLQKIFEQPISL